MVEVLKYEQVNHGKKIGYVDILLPKIGLIIRHLVHLQSGNKRWINFPTFPKDEGEKRIFHPYFEFTQGPHNTEFLEKVNEAVKLYCEKNQITFPDPLNLQKEGTPF